MEPTFKLLLPLTLYVLCAFTVKPYSDRQTTALNKKKKCNPRIHLKGTAGLAQQGTWNNMAPPTQPFASL